MNKLKIFRLSLLLMATTIFVACDEGGVTKNIILQNSESLNQIVYADEKQGNSGVSFTTTGAWTSRISTITPIQSESLKATPASAPEWISISPDAGKKAGDYTIEISLLPNTTGADRTAIITISCNGTDIMITITQKSTKEDGTAPEEPSVSDGRVKKINGKSLTYTGEHDGIFTVSAIGSDLYGSKFISDHQWSYLTWDNYGLGEERCDYEYGNGGYLSKIRANVYFLAIASETTGRVAEFHWDNGELSYIRGDQRGVERGNVYLRTDLEYGDAEYTLGNIDINWLLSTYEYYTGSPVSAIGVKTTKKNKLLVKKTQTEEDGSGKYTATSTYRYVFNENKYITGIYETSTLYNGGEENLIYTFEY